MSTDNETNSMREAIRIYNTGYHAGHHDTVEGRYVDIVESDMETYHEETVQDMIEVGKEAK